jgi:hypothetical protein|tara:strand:+ start:5765 stop:6823 length:1059 start_codon:yes stop_codon:yes gene_type:complete
LKKLLTLILVVILTACAAPKKCCGQFDIKKAFKFSTFYASVNGGTSISDVDVFSVNTGVLQQDIIETPYDYNLSLGVRKIARFGYENRAQTFYDGTETSWSDGANVGKVSGLEFLFEANYKRQQGVDYLDQHHFIRFVEDQYILKGEYLEDGFADIKYFETSQRYRYKVNRELSFNIGAVQRLSEPYGFDPLEEWMLSNGNLHYTYLAIQEGYTIDVFNSEYKDPNGNVVATSSEVWEAIVIPQVLSDYAEKKRNELDNTIQHSMVIGFDYYYYKKDFWAHSWANLMPYHYDDNSEFSYHKYNKGQWLDYSGGLIFGYKYNKNLGTFLEGKYNKYWNREWYDFKLGINYIIF